MRVARWFGRRSLALRALRFGCEPQAFIVSLNVNFASNTGFRKPGSDTTGATELTGTRVRLRHILGDRRK